MNPAPPAFRTSLPPRQHHIVGIGELAVSSDPNMKLSTYGLGSCVGIAAYDPVARGGGLVHIMLPNSAIDLAKSREQPALFADTALPLLIERLLELPVERSRLRFLVAGGAAMHCSSQDFDFGRRNTRVTFEYLTNHQLPVCASDIGGTANRTLHLDIATGSVILKADTEVSVHSLA